MSCNSRFARIERISEMDNFQIDNKGNHNLDILSKNKKGFTDDQSTELLDYNISKNKYLNTKLWPVKLQNAISGKRSLLKIIFSYEKTVFIGSSCCFLFSYCLDAPRIRFLRKVFKVHATFETFITPHISPH